MWEGEGTWGSFGPRNPWEFPNLIVSNLVVCNFNAEASLFRSFAPFPVLPFLVFFGKWQGKPPKKTRIFYPYRTPKIPGKEGKNAQKRIFYPYRTPKIPGKEGKNAQKKQGIPCRAKKQGIPKKNKERKDRVRAPFGALLQACVCALLRSFACFCVRPRLERLRLGTAELWYAYFSNLGTTQI